MNARAIICFAAFVTSLICATETQASVNDMCIVNQTEDEKGWYVVNAANNSQFAKITFDAGPEQAMRIYSNTGGLSFYLNDALRYAFTPDGAFKLGGGNWVVPSDRRIKKNIQPYTGGLAKLRLVKPRVFNYNGRLTIAPDDGVDQIGVVAQEVRQVFPEMVTEASDLLDDNPVLVVDPSNFTLTLINSIKEQQQAIERLQSKTRKLEALLCAGNARSPICKSPQE